MFKPYYFERSFCRRDLAAGLLTPWRFSSIRRPQAQPKGRFGSGVYPSANILNDRFRREGVVGGAVGRRG
jgi:hypothetical protein